MRLRLLGLPVDERVLRGGSFNNNQNNARAAYRNNNNPNERNNNIGFRLVCSSHASIRFIWRNRTYSARCVQLRLEHTFQTCPAVTASGRRQKQ